MHTERTNALLPPQPPQPFQYLTFPLCGPSSTRCAPSSRFQCSFLLGGPASLVLSLSLQPSPSDIAASSSSKNYIVLTLTPTLPKSELALSRDTLAYELGSALSRVHLLVSFSASAELVWRYPLEVTITVNRIRSLDRSSKKCSDSNPNPTLEFSPNPNPNPNGHIIKPSLVTLTLSLRLTITRIPRSKQHSNPNPNPNPRLCEPVSLF